MLFKRLKPQLLFGFSIIIALLVLTFLGSGYLYNKKNTITGNIRELDDIRVLALKNFKLMDDYVSYETVNEYYFQTGESNIKSEFESNYFDIIARLQSLKPELLNASPQIASLIDSLIISERIYYQNFSKLEELVLIKGYKDYGIEGRMRDYAHELMEIDNHDINYLALSLRRHEKDYIIRSDLEYFNKFNQVYEDLVQKINSLNIPQRTKEQYFNIAYNYKKYFWDYYNLQFEIGVNENEGVLKKLKKNYETINSCFNRGKNMSVDLDVLLDKRLKIYNISLIVLSLLMAVLLGYIYASRITDRVNKLKQSMTNYVDSGFKDIPESDRNIGIVEFHEMNDKFLHMVSEINSYVDHFKIKVEERTAEIRWQKEEILQQNLKISSQHQQLKEQQMELLAQQQLLSEKNRNFLESVRHAEKIQHALLPSHRAFEKQFKDAFVFFQPRDIVSGDFYWLEEIEIPIIRLSNSKLELAGDNLDIEEIEEPQKQIIMYEKRILFALADCTGHGVPGAFMSIVGINHLNKIVKERRVNEPDEILNALNHDVCNSFYKSDDELNSLKDGMEIAFCSYIPDKKLLQFAGANKNLLMVRGDHVYEFKGNKKSVGNYPSLSSSFEKIDIKLQEGDIIYLFTDGYQDQFGGEHNKKFKTRNLKQLLQKINDYPMKDQHLILKDNFNNWKGEGFQVDDVSIIGIRL